MPIDPPFTKLTRATWIISVKTNRENCLTIARLGLNTHVSTNVSFVT